MVTGEQIMCPRCENPLESSDNMYYWRGRRFKGLVCKKCKALYDDPSDSFQDYVEHHRD